MSHVRYSVDILRTVPYYFPILYDRDEAGSRAPLRSSRITATGAEQSSTWQSTTTEKTTSPPTRPPSSRTLTTPSSKTTTVRCGTRQNKVTKTSASAAGDSFAKKLAPLLTSTTRTTEPRTQSTSRQISLYGKIFGVEIGLNSFPENQFRDQTAQETARPPPEHRCRSYDIPC